MLIHLFLSAVLPTQLTVASIARDLEPAWYGTTVADAGDADLDGNADVLVGAFFDDAGGKHGSVTLFSGRSGEPLRVVRGGAQESLFGLSVAGAGDTDSDTAADFMVGAPLEVVKGKATGAVHVYSGKSGKELHAIAGDQAGEWFGYAVNSAGDVDQDGLPDVVVGAPQAEVDKGGAVGTVRVFSSRTGNMVHEWHGDAPGDLFGCSVDNVGDTDGDGASDIAVGAWGGDYVRWYSGRTGKVLHEVRGTTARGRFGWCVRRAGDTNQNGLGDVVIGIPGGMPEAARTYSGKDGKLLLTIERSTKAGEEAWSQGIAVDGAGDVNGDGFADVVVGDPGYPELILDASMHPMAASLTGFRAKLARKGVVRVLSGHDGKELFEIYGDSNDDRFGVSVSTAGDVDQDGMADIVVGTGRSAGYAARVYSGKSGKLLHELSIARTKEAAAAK